MIKTLRLPTLSDKAGKIILEMTTAKKKKEPNKPNSYLGEQYISNSYTQLIKEYFDE